MVPHKVDTGSNRSVMPLYIFKKYFLGQQRTIGDNKKYRYQTKNV